MEFKEIIMIKVLDFNSNLNFTLNFDGNNNKYDF